jgi:hypothetical protein
LCLISQSRLCFNPLSLTTQLKRNKHKTIVIKLPTASSRSGPGGRGARARKISVVGGVCDFLQMFCGKGTRRHDFLSKWSQNGLRWSRKGAKSHPNGVKREPKRGKGTPKGPPASKERKELIPQPTF